MNNLLTPADLAKEPLLLNAQAGEYDFTTQTRGFDSSMAASWTTFNGTRTYDAGGRPRDHDND
jgi:hypothetical protein